MSEPFIPPDQVRQIAICLLGAPNKRLSRDDDLRFGSNGSVSVKPSTGEFYDHERGDGGGVIDLIRREGETDPAAWLARHGFANGHTQPNGSSKSPNGKATAAPFHIVETYSYRDEGGAELFQTCRLENGETTADGKKTKSFFQRRPDGNGGYVNGIAGVRQVPYRLPELTEAVAKQRWFFLCEGERKCDRLAALGLVATCNAMGAGKWPDALTPYFSGARFVILPDNDEAGRRHAQLVARRLKGVAARVLVLDLPDLPPKGDVVDWLDAGGTRDALARLAKELAYEPDLDSAGDAPGRDKPLEATQPGRADDPLPLFPPLPPSEPFPLEALGAMLSRAARAIANKAQVPGAMAAQSVLAAASLAACSHADVMLPYGQTRPLALYFATIAASGDRKSTADKEALWPVAEREKSLREEHAGAMKNWRVDLAAWQSEKRKIETDKRLDLSGRKERLASLGGEPEKPLAAFLVTGDLTVEGLTKNWPNAHAALGVFTAEGGTFTAGHGMNDDNRLKTAAMLSELWDGKPVKRVRALDGVTILPGRRLALHIMIQPDAAAGFLCNDTLRDQGLLSRLLLAPPESLAGTRKYREPNARDDAAINAYGARILSLLETEPALEPGKRNELTPRALAISADAAGIWREFYDHIESQCGSGNPLASIGDFAAKAAEHAARIAGVITIVEDLHAKEVGLETMQGAIELVNWYVREADRLKTASRTDPKLLRAAKVLEWLQAQPNSEAGISKILTSGPHAMRTKAAAEESVAILAAHGWITEVSSRPRVIRVVSGKSAR